MEKEVLKILRENAGKYVSGQEISRGFDVSRTAIWKSIEALREKGFRIDSSPRRGYRFEAGPEHIVGLDIEVGLGTRLIGNTVVSFDTVPSTIDVAISLAQENAAEGTVVVAESQAGGRGRLGRKWSSPAGVGIWCSVILRPPVPPRDAPKLTLLIAVSVARVLNQEYGLDAGIKWPNDVVLNGKKICGALTELVAEQDAVRYMIASFGLNVNQTRSKFPEEVRSIATSMRIESRKKLDRPEVFRRVLRELDAGYVRFKKGGGEEILEQWRELSCTLGQHVKVQLRGETLDGIARDLDDDGSLLVEASDGVLRAVAYGDVTILR